MTTATATPWVRQAAPLKARYTVELVEKDDKHFYRVAGETALFPSVTTILGAVYPKPWLAPWAAKMAAERVRNYLKVHAVNRPLTPAEIDLLVETGRKEHTKQRDDAAELGTRAHQAIDVFLKTGAWGDVPADILPATEAFKSWYSKTPVEVVMGDTKTASKKHAFAGSLDILGKNQYGYGIVDLKTSNQISFDYALQVGGYAIAFKETYGQDIEWAMILRVGKKKAEFEAKAVLDLTGAKRTFLICRELYDRFKEPLL